VSVSSKRELKFKSIINCLIEFIRHLNRRRYDDRAQKYDYISRDNIKISVIIPVYNVDQYLRQCLSTVVSQVMPDIEIICVDDSSTDQSLDILNEYSERNPAFTILKHNKNRGLSAARNTGIEASNGEYVLFLDSDDFLAHKVVLSDMYQVACTDNADEVIGGVLHWHEHTGESYLDWDEAYLESEVRSGNLINISDLRCNVIAVNKLIRRSILMDNEIRFIEGLRKYEDNPFSCKVHILAKSISIMPQTMYFYRKDRDDSLMMKEDRNEVEYRNIYCREIFEFIESDPKFHQYREMYYDMYVRQLLLGAVTLSHFHPSEKEIIALMNEWSKIMEVLPRELPGVPIRFKRLLIPVLQGKYMEAWDKIMAWDTAVKKGNW
jgi:glycosyltransferase involved in cell wall biosynthesis